MTALLPILDLWNPQRDENNEPMFFKLFQLICIFFEAVRFK
jgi:hypothetical protein